MRIALVLALTIYCFGLLSAALRGPIGELIVVQITHSHEDHSHDAHEHEHDSHAANSDSTASEHTSSSEHEHSHEVTLVTSNLHATPSQITFESSELSLAALPYPCLEIMPLGPSIGSIFRPPIA